MEISFLKYVLCIFDCTIYGWNIAGNDFGHHGNDFLYGLILRFYCISIDEIQTNFRFRNKSQISIARSNSKWKRQFKSLKSETNRQKLCKIEIQI